MERLEEKKQSSSDSPYSDEPMADLPPFPTRPQSHNLGAPVQVYSNFYPMKCNIGDRRVLFEYQVKTSPNLTCHTQSEKNTMRRLVRHQKEVLDAVFDNYLYFEGYVYSFEKVDDGDLPKEQSGEEEGVEYLLSFEYHQELEFTHQNVSIFFRAFLNRLIHEAGFRQVRGGKHFIPWSPKQLEGVDMFKAFYNTMKSVGGNIYLNLNPSVKFFQQTSLNDEFYRIRNQRKI